MGQAGAFQFGDGLLDDGVPPVVRFDVEHVAGLVGDKGVVLVDLVIAHFPRDDGRWPVSTAPRCTSTPTPRRVSIRTGGRWSSTIPARKSRNFLLANALY